MGPDAIPEVTPRRTIRFDVLTLFPGIFDGYLRQSLLDDAIQTGLVQVQTWNIRDWAQDKHQRVDDRPFGGGPGMVLMAQPVVDCVEAVQGKAQPPGQLVMLTPAGERLTQPVVERLAREPRLLLLCGRYEGFDDRIRQVLQPWEISVGDFVCNGGEVPAMVVIDCVIRLIPGVLGDETSAQDESHSVPGRIEYPQYTRPRVYRGLDVPAVLLSGNHGAVATWRREQSERRSRDRRDTLAMTTSLRRLRDYLDEMEEPANATLGLSIMHLIRKTESEAPARARELLVRTRSEIGDPSLQDDLLELIERIVVYKLPKMSPQEIENMLQLNDLRETRFYQEVLQEGIAVTIRKLAEKKLTAEEIAKLLDLEVDQVRQTISAVKQS